MAAQAWTADGTCTGRIPGSCMDFIALTAGR